jgi:hypothetical protein
LSVRIRGNVLEVKHARHTRRIGRGSRPHVVDIDRYKRDAGLHADPNVLGSLPVGSFDCVILTQVPQLLSPETALAKVWASLAFWRFTPKGLAELLHRLGMPASVAGYGNVLACVASLWGPSVKEPSAEELDVADSRVPLVACAHAEKAR